MNGQRNAFLRTVRARPRIFMATPAALAVGYLLPSHWAIHTVTRLLVAWNVGACLYVLLAIAVQLTVVKDMMAC